MNVLAGLGIALLTIFIAGYGLTALLVRSARPLHVIEHLCHAWLLGCGIVSLFLWCGGFYLSGLGLKAVVTVSCLLLGVIGWRSKKVRGTQRTEPRPKSPLEWVFLIILGLEIGAIVFRSLSLPLGWDGSFNWETKARFAFLNGGVMPANYFSGVGQINSHPDYPLLIPWTELWLYLWMGTAHQFWVKIIFPLYGAVGSILLAIIGARISGRRWAGGLVAVLLFFVPYLFTGAGGALNGYADFPLSVLYLAAIGYLLIFQRTGDPDSLRLSLAALALLPWLKREGAILWAVGAFCAVVAIFALRRKKIWLAALLPGLLILAGWHLQLMEMRAVPNHDFVPVTIAALWENIARTFFIARAVWHEVMQADHWSLFWLLVGVALFSRLCRVRDLTLLLLATALVVPIAAYSSSFLFSTWPDLGAHIQSSIPRLLLHVTPLGWLAIALALPLARTGRPARMKAPVIEARAPVSLAVEKAIS